MRQLDPFLREKRLHEINMEVLWSFIHAWRERDGVVNSTVNRALEIVRRILNLAHQEWSWLQRVPRIRMLKEPKRRIRFLTSEEADRLNAWERSLRRAGIEAFRFHDLRHTWASWHVMSGTSLQQLMELGGWKSYEMVLRYAHFSAEHLAPYAYQLCALRVVDDACHGTNQAHPTNEKGAS